MISLKKSFEYQNYLDELQRCATNLLGSNFMVTVNRHHFINAVNHEAEDKVETIEDSKKSEYSFITPNQLVGFAQYIMNERTRLSAAIATAKHNGSDYDLLIAQNSERRKMLFTFEQLISIKGGERKSKWTAYKFNVDGEQTSYEYDIKDVTTIDFDRNNVKAIVSKLRKECQYVSEKLDHILVMREVDFESIFEIGDYFEEAVTKYLTVAIQ